MEGRVGGGREGGEGGKEREKQGIARYVAPCPALSKEFFKAKSYHFELFPTLPTVLHAYTCTH